jgi:hypothetical protein
MPAPSRWPVSAGRPETVHKSKRKREVAPLADPAVGCALGYLAFHLPHIGWRGEHAHLARLHDKLAKRQSFIDTGPHEGPHVDARFAHQGRSASLPCACWQTVPKCAPSQRDCS